MKVTLAAAYVLLVACGHPPADAPAEPPSVRTAPVATGDLAEWLRLPGRVVAPPDRDATLSPRVEGVLSEVSVRVGDRVARGQVVARVDSAALVDGVAAAEAVEKSAAADAQAKHKVGARTRSLFERGVVSGEQAEIDEAAAVAADAALTQARSALASASRRRDWASVAAPFDGVVVRVLRQAGESVDGTAATPVVEVAAEHPVEVALDAPAAALAQLKAGQRAEIAVHAAATTKIPARVKGVAGAVDATTGTGPVRLDPTNDDPALVLGRIVEARIAVAVRPGVPFVPASALRGGAKGTVEAVVVEGHKARVKTVATGIRDGDRVEIVSGLAAGDRVVVDDPVGLADGVEVLEQP